MSGDNEYVFGTHDDEIARLGLQHSVWRPRALDAWRRAGVTVGQTIIDLGCGPGYGSQDLAEIVGPSGKIIAIDKSRRFLDFLESRCRQRGVTNVVTHELDLNDAALPAVEADGAWTRWVLAFIKQPRRLLERVAERLKRGGVFVIHEYFAYTSWRLMPRSPELEEFVDIVMKSWRGDGGEPDIALDLPVWLKQLGFEIRALNPLIDVISPTSYAWHWPKSFIHVGLRRLADLGAVSRQRADEIASALSARMADPEALMSTPGVLEIIAIRK